MVEKPKQESGQMNEEKRNQNAFKVSIGTGVVFALITLSVMLINRSVNVDLSLAMVILTMMFAFLSAWLSRHKKSELGVLLIITGLLATIVARVFAQKGLAIPTGVTNIILVTAIASYTLPPKWLSRAIGASVFTTLVTIIIDQYTTDIAESSNYQAGLVIALVLGAMYMVFLARQFPTFNLRTRLILGFLFLSTVPLVVLGWLTYATSQQILQDQIKASLSESANSTGGELEDFINEQTEVMQTEVKQTDLINYLSLPPFARIGSETEKRTINTLAGFAAKNRHIISYAIIDKNGKDLLDTFAGNLGAEYGKQDFFKQPAQTRQAYFSGALFHGKPVIYFSAPIIKEDSVIGVLVATYHAQVLQVMVENSVKYRTSGTQYTALLDSAYFINLAHSSRPELLYKSYLNLDSAEIYDLQEKNLLGEGLPAELIEPQAELLAQLEGMGIQKSFQTASWENNGEPAETIAVRVPNTEWIVVTSQPLKSIAALTQTQTRAIVIASIAIILAAAVIALFASNFFTNPIIELTRVAEKLSAGDFTQKANIRSQDEIGVLGNTLNQMTDQMQDLIDSLEKRVSMRTVELASATQQSEKRASELQTIAEISRQISTEKDMENLLQLITHTVSERFGFYHVGVFLLNETKKFAILRAANSTGGQVMLQRQHKLEVGQTGIVGNVTAIGKPRIALDTGADKVYFNNPDLPDTHSEMALPLNVRGEIIGALDVQSTERNAFTESDIFTLSVLADQIAIAIENVNLLAQSQKALSESQAMFREYLTEAWQSKTATNVIGYYQSITGGSPITKSKIAEVEAAGAEKNKIEIPIQLRGQTIGALNIILKKDHEELSEGQMSIIRAVLDRLGLALENARLFEETSSRAQRERMVTEITTKIRGTNNPQEMIKTAMDELQRALGAARVEVVPKKSAAMQDR